MELFSSASPFVARGAMQQALCLEGRGVEAGKGCVASGTGHARVGAEAMQSRSAGC